MAHSAKLIRNFLSHSGACNADCWTCCCTLVFCVRSSNLCLFSTKSDVPACLRRTQRVHCRFVHVYWHIYNRVFVAADIHSILFTSLFAHAETRFIRFILDDYLFLPLSLPCLLSINNIYLSAHPPWSLSPLLLLLPSFPHLFSHPLYARHSIALCVHCHYWHPSKYWFNSSTKFMICSDLPFSKRHLINCFILTANHIFLVFRSLCRQLKILNAEFSADAMRHLYLPNRLR